MGVILAVFGLIVTAAWLAMAAIYISAGIGFDNIMLLLPSELGQLLGGIFLPLVVLWLVLLFFQLGRRVHAIAPVAVAPRPVVQIQQEPAMITHNSAGQSHGLALEARAGLDAVEAHESPPAETPGDAEESDRPARPTDLPEALTKSPLRPKGMATRAFVKRIKHRSRIRSDAAGQQDDAGEEGLRSGVHGVIAARHAALQGGEPATRSWDEPAAASLHDAPVDAPVDVTAETPSDPAESETVTASASGQAAAPENGAQDPGAETSPYGASRARPYVTDASGTTPPLGFRHSVRIAALELNSVAMEMIAALSQSAVHDKALKDYDNGQKEIFFDLLLSHLSDRDAKDVARDLALLNADHHLGSYAQIYENLIKESKRIDPHGGLAKSLDAMTIGRLYAKIQGVRAAAGQLAEPARA